MNDLFEANAIDETGFNWRYLWNEPFDTVKSYSKWLREQEPKEDLTFFSIVRKSDEKVVGMASFLRIDQKNAVIEVGRIHFSPFQRIREATEAMFLMMKWVFGNGYRRYEWKCDSFNIKSRKTAQCLGFSYEGVFRQMMIIKNRNRDTA